MADDKKSIQPDIQRFIVTCIPSVPHFEAILLFLHQPEWNVKELSQQLFIAEKRAEELLVDLCEAGFIKFQREAASYEYHPSSAGLKEMLECLPKVYAEHMVEVHHLIHSKTHKQARQFGDAFKWNPEKE